jgi:hypothetical protein
MVSVGHRRGSSASAIHRGKEDSLGNISSLGTIEDGRLFPSLGNYFPFYAERLRVTKWFLLLPKLRNACILLKIWRKCALQLVSSARDDAACGAP